MTDRLTRNGFDIARLRFAARTALACWLAILLAWLMGLEHPQWSGMSVWAASQPLRGMLLEKSFFRMFGTLVGTVAGIGLVLGSQMVHPAVLVVGLAVWIGLCTWFGNLQRGVVTYGTVLAGYSASMVALLDTKHPDLVFHLGADRLATVLTGVVVATLVGYYFAKRTDEKDLRGRVTRLVARLLREGGIDQRDGDRRRYLSELAAIDEDLEPHAAGSISSRHEIKRLRAVLLAVVPLLMQRTPERDPRTASVADALERGDGTRAARLLSTISTETESPLGRLAAALAELVPEDGSAVSSSIRRVPAPAVFLHRDWLGAREAGLRAGGGMLLFGLIWLFTGWDFGGFMLLGLSVMISLFSTFESPAITMRHIILGQFLGVLAALAVRWMAWPIAANELQQLLLFFPFIMIAPLLVAHRRTVIAATDFSMIMLLMSQPGLPLTGTFGDSIVKALAVLAGPVVALAAYLFVFPINLQRRQQHLLEITRRELAGLAATPLSERINRQVLEARMYHRVLRLVRISERLARAEERAKVAGKAMFVLQQTVFLCRELASASNTTPTVRRAAELVMGRIGKLDNNPRTDTRAFRLLAERLNGSQAQAVSDAGRAYASLIAQG